MRDHDEANLLARAVEIDGGEGAARARRGNAATQAAVLSQRKQLTFLLYGISTVAPVVCRPSSARCASAAFARGNSCCTSTFTVPFFTTSTSSAAIFSSISR